MQAWLAVRFIELRRIGDCDSTAKLKPFRTGCRKANMNKFKTQTSWLLLLAFAVLVLFLPQNNWLNADDSKVSDESFPNLLKERPSGFERPFLIEFHGMIDWQLAKYFRAKIEQARKANADLIVIEIDSPGGLKTESLSIAEMVRDIDWAYTVAFVPREAFSGAALVTLGCDELVIGKLARIGDIGVIKYDPQLFAFRFAEEKIQSVLIRQARDLAQSKGRSVELAEAMINKDYHVYQRIQDDELEFIGQLNDADPPEGAWQIVPETTKGFLTVNGVRAKELKLAQTFADSRESASNKIGFELTEARVLRHTATDTIVYYLNHPIGTILLIVIGLIAFFVEISAAGFGFGGLVSGLCATLFFWSRFLGGTSTWLEVVLFAAGVTFLLMELFVIPGWGISGITGLFLTVASVFMASQDFVMPSNDRQWNQFLTSLLMLLCSGTLFVVAAAFIIRNIGHVPVLSKLILAPPVDVDDTDTSVDEAGKPKPAPHPAVSVGDWGKAESLLRPAGRAMFVGRSFDVVSDGEFIESGRQIKVIAVQGNRIVVAAVQEEDLESTTPGSGRH